MNRRGGISPSDAVAARVPDTKARLARWLTADEVAELLAVSKRTVYELAAGGKLPARRFTAGAGLKMITRFDPRDIDAFREACAKPARG